MRVRTVVTFAAGAATGAGVMYVFDPEAGAGRRRELRRDALQQAREGAVAAGKAGRQLATDLGTAAVDGYRQARSDAGPSASSL